jgi:hypothetical protein
MKPRSKQELSEMLSQYIDGELTERQAREIEEYIAGNPEAARELQELQAMKKLLASKKRLPETLGFWTRLSSQIERKEKEQENLLPFPRRYLPLVYVTGVVAVLLVGFLLFQQRTSVIDYVSRQSEVVQKAVQDNVLKGTLFPLFSNVDKNQALQFALFGALPLDAKSETALRVDESADRGYRIDVGKKSVEAIPKVTMSEFVSEIKPTRRQIETIDSVLEIGRRRIESSVFVAEDRGMAIDPNIMHLNRMMLSGIASSLEPPQRVRFEKFLELRKAPYMITASRATPESPERIYHEFRQTQRTNGMIVVTPDTLMISQIQLDIDSLRRHFNSIAAVQPEIRMRFGGLIKRIAEREASFRKHIMIRTEPLMLTGDSEAFTIEIGRVFEEMPAIARETWIRPRAPIPVTVPGRSRLRPFNFNMNFDERDSSFMISLDLDSIMMRLQKDGPEAAFEFFMGDPNLRSRGLRSQDGKTREQMDSIMKAKKRSRARLDSLIRVKERELRERE